MILALLLCAPPATPTPVRAAPTPFPRNVILYDDDTTYTATYDFQGQRIVILKRPDGKTISTTPDTIDREATRLANLGPLTRSAPPTPKPVQVRRLGAPRPGDSRARGPASPLAKAFANVAWGAPRSEDMKLVRSDGTSDCYAGKRSVEGLPATSALYCFANDRFTEAVVTFQGRRFHEVLNRLTAVWGKPERTEADSATWTAPGATVARVSAGLSFDSARELTSLVVWVEGEAAAD